MDSDFENMINEEFNKIAKEILGGSIFGFRIDELNTDLDLETKRFIVCAYLFGRSEGIRGVYREYDMLR